MAELKEWLSFQGQMELLTKRGCVVDNADFCIDTLRRVNYYRLSAYLLPYKTGEEYTSGINFLRIYRIFTSLTLKCADLYLQQLRRLRYTLERKSHTFMQKNMGH